MENLFKIKYDKKFPFIHISNDNLLAIFIISLFLGIVGFVFETILTILMDGLIVDRGFLNGPFLPIYFVFSFISLLVFKTCNKSFENYMKYFVIFALLVTFLEFFTGNILELLTNAQLWNYDHLPMSYKYISLPVSITWGLACSFYFIFVVPILYKIYLTMSYHIKTFILYAFIVIFPCDLLLTIIDIIGKSRYITKYYFYITDDILTLILLDLFIFFLLSFIAYLLIKKSRLPKSYVSVLLLVLYMTPIIYTILYLYNY